MNVRDNIAFGLKAQGLGRAERYRIAEPYIRKVGLTGLLAGWLADRILVMTALPGRIKDICDVSTIFPRPRRVEQVKRVRSTASCSGGSGASFVRKCSRPPASRWSPERTERLLSVVSPLLLLGLWEFCARIGAIDTRFFPAPSSIFRVLWLMFQPTEQYPQGELWFQLSASLSRIAIGFLIGALPGVCLGLAMGPGSMAEPAAYVSCARNTAAVAAARDETPSLAKMLSRWRLTVLSLKMSASAI